MSSRQGDGVLSVVVADPHRGQRDGICAIIDREPDLRVIAVAWGREDGTRLMWELQPDGAIIEVGLLSACEFPLHGWGPIPGHVRLVAVGLGEDPYVAATLRAAGFAAYLPASRIEAELCDALRGPRDARAGRFSHDGAVTATSATATRFSRPRPAAAARP